MNPFTHKDAKALATLLTVVMLGIAAVFSSILLRLHK